MANRRSAAVALVVGLGLFSTPSCATSAGRTYYVDPAGSDDSSGLSTESAWRTLNRVNEALLNPGDTVLLRGGARFEGPLLLDGKDAGNAASPVNIGSYGDGRAIVSSARDWGIYAHNTAGLDIHDLVVTGGPAARRTAGGISFYHDTAGQGPLDGVRISRVDVSGFKNGVEVGGATAGFRDVVVTDSAVHDNVEAGLSIYGPAFSMSTPSYANENVSISSVEAYNNSGDETNKTRNTGNGIMLGSVRGGHIEKSTAHDNGWLCSAPEGPAGIWAYDSTGIVIENSVAHDNRTGGTVDGDGFDLDQNVSDSVLRHNRAYDNDGAGFLLYATRAGTANTGNTVQDNTSENSPRRPGWYGGITVAGHVSGARVHDNTVTGPGAPITVDPAAAANDNDIQPPNAGR
ncbi:right-handed parallel beta-helix repeat-containing protein [Kutzneria sp. NPDC052558]|uniref:right-handed parallel beta-helix repeat-containing protein n=1 Tax=Kutzneria sp. NPDC052558 TaxID=3364121 RepID=UPI0037C6FD9E